MAVIRGSGMGSPTIRYADPGPVSRGGGGGPRRGGRAKTYSDARAGGARFGATYTPGQKFRFPLGGWGGGGYVQVLQIINEKTNENIFVNTEGYDYARYVGVV